MLNELWMLLRVFQALDWIEQALPIVAGVVGVAIALTIMVVRHRRNR